MSIPQMTSDLAIIQKLDDLPNAVDGLTAQELKARFDESGLAIQKWINEVLLPGFQAKNMAFSGNASLNAETVQEAIEAVHGQVRDASSGTIVDGAVTREKLAVDLLKRVYGGRPYVSLNTPGSAQNKEADFPIGQIWLRPAFTVVNAAGSNWQAKGCTVAVQENGIRVIGDQSVVTASATQALSGIGQDGDRVMVLFDIQNKDSEITDLTVSLNSGEAMDSAAGVFEGTLVGGALTVEFSVTWPSTSLADGSFDVVNYAVVNLDQVLRQTTDAEDMTDWAGFLNGLLPLDSYTSPEEVFIQTINGTWWSMGKVVCPVERGGTGLNAIGKGELLVGGDGNTMDKVAAAASDGNSFLMASGGTPAWSGVEETISNNGILRVETGSYTGNGKSGRTVSFGVTPKMLHISTPRGRWKTIGASGWSDYPIVLAQGCSDIATFSDSDVNYDATEETVTLSGSKVTVGKYFCNSSGITYNWVAIY